MTIKLTAKNLYGRTIFYPANNEARLLAQIAGTATLTRQALELAKAMGCEIVVDAEASMRGLLAA